MKKSIKKSPKKSLIVSSLAVAVQGLLLASLSTVAHADTTTVKKPIGDLEIYQTAKGGKITLMMMLDTSGSMLADAQDTSACDFPNGENLVTIKKEQSNTTPRYERTICTATGTRRYRYAFFVPRGQSASRGIYYECNPNSATCLSWTREISRPSDLGAYTEEVVSNNISVNNQVGTMYRYHKTTTLATPITNPDRLTRLKDALFKLLDKDDKGNYLLDTNKREIAIGIGQFSGQSDENNKVGIPDGTTGKILVPARLLTDAQRDELRTVTAQLIGGGGTPSANAYAEAGAYMLGTNTQRNVMNVRKEKYIRLVGGANPIYRECVRHAGVLCLSWGNQNISSIQVAPLMQTEATCIGRTDYKCYSETFSGLASTYGLSGFPKSAVATKDTSNYISPIQNAASCDGHGIYFLTDGEPNSSYQPEDAMRTALGDKAGDFSYSNSLPNGTQSLHGTPQVGGFARSLREADKNPKDVSIRTAVVGFGSIFNISKYDNAERTLSTPELNKETSLYIPGKFKGGTTKYIDCTKILAQDAQNACNWGAKSHPELPGVGGYGEGGFYSAQSTDDVINSVTEFLGDLINVIDTTPSGTISIPDDPYSVAGQQAVAYMPMIEPKVASHEMIWPGNMKKYHLRNGTIWGKNGQRLYTNVQGDLNANAQDGWSASTAGNNQVKVGGFYANLKDPKGNVENVRQLFIEDFSGAGAEEADKKPKARKFGVNAQGKITLDGNAISASNTFHDTTTYNLATVKYLLHFLGFTNAKVGNTTYSLDEIPAGTALTNITLQAPTDEIRVLGGSPHSTPTALSYSAELDDSGNVSLAVKDRDDYVLFGSMDGALHLVDARDTDPDRDSTTGVATGGSEVFAFIPKVMLANQVKALQQGAKYDDINKTGQPVFGVDAPWAVVTDYDYDNDDNPTKMQVDTSGNKGVYAYGGFRLGGEGLYGLKLNDKNNPELKFALTPQTTGFERLGQIWAKPTKAKIKSGDGSRDVLIFGGGYDLCYENQNFQVGATNETYTITQNQRGEACEGKAEAVGNAVYMVDAHTGALLWTGTSGDMKHSIVASVNTLDRDNDGNLDAIYFADLGGQVFRADFDNVNGSSTSAKRIVRLLKPAQGGSKYARRFYEKPVISIYRGDGQFNNGQLFALVNVISGDRSNPTSKMRVGKANADRLYGIFDTDIGKRDLYTLENTALFAREIEDAHLEDLSGINGQAAKPGKITAVKGKKGWYHPIVDFDGYTNVNYGKGIGKSEVIGSLLFSSVYNPDKQYATAQTCVASIKGGTERQMYCLPYGVCMNARSTNGKGGFSPAGQGISELTLGPLDGTTSGSRKRTLISNVGLNPDGSTGANRTNFGEGVAGSSIEKNQAGTGATKEGGTGSHPDIIADPRFTLQPVRWYDNSVKN